MNNTTPNYFVMIEPWMLKVPGLRKSEVLLFAIIRDERCKRASREAIERFVADWGLEFSDRVWEKTDKYVYDYVTGEPFYGWSKKK